MRTFVTPAAIVLSLALGASVATPQALTYTQATLFELK